jgi:eukaryotic-like serine/threonine-protein kinase
VSREVSEPRESVLAADTRVGEFRIRGLLGEGAMGQVYLAQDVTLGRRVALKLLKRSVMDSHGLDHFLDEARATASFNHPNIVALHAVGEFDGRPFLALEYVDGESLRARIASGPLSVREAARVVRAVAEAIGEAHRRDLVHADLKPENILIPQDGRVRVVDFGLAKLVGTNTGTTSGTPAYMAPERWHGAPPTGAIDVWSLGIILYEAITGSRPFTEQALTAFAFARTELDLRARHGDASWLPVAQACLAREPAARPSADEVARRLAAVLDPAIATLDDSRCPFPGLAAFARSDAGNYFGRQAELDTLIEQLRIRALVPIIGPSGIGKSSFVYAGLLPRLEELAMWTVIQLRPGASPFHALASALTSEAAGELAASLRSQPARLSLALAELSARLGTRILLFVDQFEEVFTLAAPEAVAFCDCLALAAIPEEPWRIVITVRDDFLGRLAEPIHMRPHLGAVLVLPPLTAADLHAAVIGPLASVRYRTDAPDLAARIVDDVLGQPAGLPVLQFACCALWDRRDATARVLLSREYDAMGGASGALATHAERFMAQLSPDQVRLVRSVLLEIVHPDGTRRPRLRRELCDAIGPGAGAAIDQLLDYRLLVATRDAERDDARIELAHEALSRTWPPLARWLDETYEQRLLVAELEQAAMLWKRRGERDDETWTGAALEEAVRKIARWNVQLPELSRRFLDASNRRARRLRQRRRSRIWMICGGLGAVALVAVFAAVAFARKERLAIEQGQQLALASADLGMVDLELEPFDWEPEHQVTMAPRVPPSLTWRLHATAPDDPWRFGRDYGATDVHRGAARWVAGVLVERLEVRSGPAFLEIDRGADCAPSVVFLQRLPGYHERAAVNALRIHVPTCQASLAGTVWIPAGDFIRNVTNDSGAVDVPASLPDYGIDRTEVTRGAFGVFSAMSALTGQDAAPADHMHFEPAQLPYLPVSGIAFAVARSYCRYMGKDLPTTDQWQKAFRGGRTMLGVENPSPARRTPWLHAAGLRPANVALREDGWGTLAPVGTYLDDSSPYGVVDLGGNVSEWSLDASPTMPRLRRVLGASWTTPPSAHREEIIWRNSRPDQSIDYAVGMRCVAIFR